jgi:hypothetical protein
VNDSMHIDAVASTPALTESLIGCDFSESLLQEVVGVTLLQLVQTCVKFITGPVSPSVTFEFERNLALAVRELGRRALEWSLNRVAANGEPLPSHVEFDGGLFTKLNRSTPRGVSTLFGEVVLRRLGYRDTYKCGEPAVFPAEQALGIADGTTPALAERVAAYQAEAGATQLQTLNRLKVDHGLSWGVKKLRRVVERIAEAMAKFRHEVQVEKLLELLEKADATPGKNEPVLCVGRDGITVKIPAKKATFFEVASVATVSVYDRCAKRLGTIYLAQTPEPKPLEMTTQLTAIIQAVLMRWQKTVPQLAYVTDAGDNETSYYNRFLHRMKHPRTQQQLSWMRVVDFYHASTRLWTMAEALFETSPLATGWARKMRELLKKKNGVRRVLNSASRQRALHKMTGNRAKEFNTAYNYLRGKTQFMRYNIYNI